MSKCNFLSHILIFYIKITQFNIISIERFHLGISCIFLNLLAIDYSNISRITHKTQAKSVSSCVQGKFLPSPNWFFKYSTGVGTWSIVSNNVFLCIFCVTLFLIVHAISYLPSDYLPTSKTINQLKLCMF